MKKKEKQTSAEEKLEETVEGSELQQEDEAAPEAADAPEIVDAATLAEENEALKNALDAAVQEVETMKDQMLRAMADLDNTKKRLERDQGEFRKYAAEGCMRRLLPIIDSLSQALKADFDRRACKHLVDGVEMIFRQLHDVLKQENVVPIDSLGKTFDPHLHEAVLQIDVDDPEQDHKVVEELQHGYTMHGKVLRSSMVKIGKYAGKDSDDG